MLLALIGMRMVNFMLSDESVVLRGEENGTKPAASRLASSTPGLAAAFRLLRSNPNVKYVIVDAKNGLANRLRALASGMSVAAALNRPLLLVWIPDIHCNCSFRNMFAPPLQFAILEEELPNGNLTLDEFQVYNYMRPEPGAIKDQPVLPDPGRHLYFKSSFLMNHPFGDWLHAQQHLMKLTPVPAVTSALVTNKGMVGMHVRNANPAVELTAMQKGAGSTASGRDSVREAQKEYGTEGARIVAKWRKASHWTNFVPRVVSLLQEHGFRHPQGLAQTPLNFYLAADSQEAYRGLSRRFPQHMLYTQRQCRNSEGCEFRDCVGTIYSLVDMLNLAHSRLILGSGWSSFSEVAAYWGGSDGKPVPTLLAGRDFGILVDERPAPRRKPGATRRKAAAAAEEEAADDDETLAAREGGGEAAAESAVMRNWPKPFDH